MIKVLFCCYREWALDIFSHIKEKYKEKAEFTLLKDEREFKHKVNILNPNLILFIGWSWIVEKEIVNKFTCICLHPSPLPKYRGGSPLQHQIINGEEESKVTLFKMNEFVDKGPILWQGNFSLKGNLNEIFSGIIERGKEGLSELIGRFLKEDSLAGTPQDESEATYYGRRTPDMSEIKLSDFEKHTAKELYDKIRALQDPYPNAFIVCKNNTKLFLQKAKIDE